jgi:hypothetical protein
MLYIHVRGSSINNFHIINVYSSELTFFHPCGKKQNSTFILVSGFHGYIIITKNKKEKEKKNHNIKERIIAVDYTIHPSPTQKKKKNLFIYLLFSFDH